MPKTRGKVNESRVNSSSRRKSKPMINEENRESHLISLSYDLVEQRLREGTATSQETTHFLKLGSKKARLENEILEEKVKLMEAQIEALKASEGLQELYANALSAMRSYQGQQDDAEEEDYDDR